MKKALCTYCSSAKKNKDNLPAIELYQSRRIQEIYNLSIEKGFDFLILSGKYGVLSPEERIDYYDHLLTGNEIEKHSQLISSQLKQKGIEEILFYSNTPEKDKNVIPYLSCIKKATKEIRIPIEIIFTDVQD